MRAISMFSKNVSTKDATTRGGGAPGIWGWGGAPEQIWGWGGAPELS